jgi:hypothetical protein
VAEASNVPVAETAREPAFRLIYRSHSRIPEAESRRALADILRQARANNASTGVTGALLMYDTWFAQVLEGPEAAVRDLYARISVDPRHDALEVREARPVNTRAFARWAMAMIGEHGEADIPLVAGASGVSEGAAWKPTEEQESVLVVLRDMTRGYGRGA